jgi:DNA-binding NarL/FixJ family response regulator
VLRALGATAWLRALGPAVAASAGPVRREGEPLTPRETEVLALLDEGRSNGEIAARLYISVKTVSVHVSNILAKFGASSRSEATALARAARRNDHSTAQPPM